MIKGLTLPDKNEVAALGAYSLATSTTLIGSLGSSLGRKLLTLLIVWVTIPSCALITPPFSNCSLWVGVVSGLGLLDLYLLQSKPINCSSFLLAAFSLLNCLNILFLSSPTPFNLGIFIPSWALAIWLYTLDNALL